MMAGGKLSSQYRKLQQDFARFLELQGETRSSIETKKSDAFYLLRHNLVIHKRERLQRKSWGRFLSIFTDFCVRDGDQQSYPMIILSLFLSVPGKKNTRLFPRGFQYGDNIQHHIQPMINGVVVIRQDQLGHSLYLIK